MNYPPEVDHLAEEVGCFIEHWGFKTIHGRVWTHVFLSSEPIDARSLQERTNASKSLISMTLTELMRYGVVEKAGKSDRGTSTYRANYNLPGVIGNVLRSREKRMIGRIFAAWQSLTDLPESELQGAKVNSRAMKEMGRLIKASKTILDGLINGALPKLSIRLHMKPPSIFRPR